MGVRKWLFATIALKIVDVVSTWYIINNHGIQAESNPIVSDMMQVYGIEPALLINTAIYSMLMLVLYRFKQSMLLVVSVGVMSSIILSNILTILGY